MANITHGEGSTSISSTLLVNNFTTSQTPSTSIENLVTTAATLITTDIFESLTTDKLTFPVSTATTPVTTELSPTTTAPTTTLVTTITTAFATTSTTTVSTPSTIEYTTTRATEANTAFFTNSTAELTTVVPSGEWMKLGVISGIALAGLILLAIVIIFCVCMLRRRYVYKRQRSMERVENPIYRKQGGETVLLTMHTPLADNRTTSLVNNNRVKNPELWASKDVAKPKPAATRKQSMERRPTLRTPAPFAANGNDGIATNDLFEKESHGSVENLNLAQYVVNNKSHDLDLEAGDANHNEATPSRPLLSHDDADFTDNSAYYSDDPARMSTFTRRR